MTVTPFKAEHAPIPEPEAVLTFGDVEIRLTLTYLHHLVNCRGWFDQQTSDAFRVADAKMQSAIMQIERTMWKDIDDRNRT